MPKLTLEGLMKDLKKQAPKNKKTEKPKPTHRERDMRDEAKNMNAYGAREYWGE